LYFLQSSCNVLLVFQRADQGDYLRYSFPSRFVDFVQTSLPIIVCAPERSNLAEYARSIGWTLLMSSPHDESGKSKIMQALNSVSGKKQTISETTQLALTDFNPNVIYGKLRDEIHKL